MTTLLNSVELEVISLTQQLKDTNKILTTTKATLLEAYKLLGVYVQTTNKLHDFIPKWIVDATSNNKSSVHIPTLLLSDLHWGETVIKSEMNGLNEYNMKIAKQRLQNIATNTIDVLFNHINNTTYTGLVLALGGDLISGGIHEELVETNDVPVLATVLDLTTNLIEFITVMTKYFPKLFIPCVVGNHGRDTKKSRYKNRNQHSYEWVIYKTLATHFKDNPDITFYIPDSLYCYYRVFNRTYLLTHGDSFKSAGGVAATVSKADQDLRLLSLSTGQSYDTLICGHFHTLIASDEFIVNGSLIGYNEFAAGHKFRPQVPKQALWLTHPTRGIVMPWSIYADTHALPAATNAAVSFGALV